MGAFIIAGIVFAVTIGATVLIVFADGMSDAPSMQGISPWPTLIGGSLISAMILASHWMPQIGW
jgi:uncharacterized membrane protein YdcZ (DUF606 family)